MNCYQSGSPRAQQQRRVYKIHERPQFVLILMTFPILPEHIYMHGHRVADICDWSCCFVNPQKKNTHTKTWISTLPFFPVCHPSPKSSEVTSGGCSVSIAALAVSVKPRRCQQIFYKVPLLHLRSRRPPLLWDRHGGICVVDHTRTVNLAPQSHWVIAIFCCPGAFHTRKMTGLNYSGCSQLSARIYRPI